MEKEEVIKALQEAKNEEVISDEDRDAVEFISYLFGESEENIDEELEEVFDNN